MKPLLIHRPPYTWGGCPLVARKIVCVECDYAAEARYTDAESYLKLNTAPYLFVYGTLKRGHRNGDTLLAGATFVGPDRAVGYATSMVAPLATRADGFVLKGEVYTDIDATTWERLDELESHYARERIVTESGLDAIIYVSTGWVPPPLVESWGMNLNDTIGWAEGYAE